MKLTSILILAGLIVFTAVLGNQLYAFRSKLTDAKKEYDAVAAKQTAAEVDNGRLKAELDYLSQPANLERELRSRFNYKNPDEKLIIMVPKASAVFSSTTEQTAPAP